MAGFEELCAQLARLETPKVAEFRRTGNPDGGVECYCTLPDGSEWGWQAKFFLAALGDSQWTQLDDSVKTSLDKHTRLVRYFVCVPRNRGDGRRDNVRYEMDRWNQHVDKWKSWAQERNMSVEFVWWGSSELRERLSRPDQIGRRYYWFGNYGFDQTWFEGRLAEAIETAGPRYTPEAHVELDIVRDLEAFARTGDWFIGIKSLAIEIRQSLGHLRRPVSNNRQPVHIPSLVPLVSAVEAVLDGFAELEFAPAGDIDLAQIHKTIANAVPLSEEADAAARDLQREYHDRLEQAGEPTRYNNNPYSRIVTDIVRLQNQLDSVNYRLREASKLANNRLLIVEGNAGTGKTHLLCDFARRRVDAGAPVVLLMGQRFTETGDPWNQALQQIGIQGINTSSFVGALEAAAQSANSRALVMIDAVNEGQGRGIWPNHLPAFLAQLETSPWIATVLSVRTSYADTVIPSHVRERTHSITHVGFRGNEYEAARIYLIHHGLEFQSTPLLDPEFANPLYLKTLCRGLQLDGVTRLPRGRQGITSVLDRFINGVNKLLSGQLDYDPSKNLVRDALQRLARQYLDTGNHWLVREEAARIVDAALPRRDYSRSLYRGMVDEGLLIEDIRAWDDDGRQEVVFVAYERFADHIVANALIKKHIGRNPLSSVLGGFRSYLNRKVPQLLPAFLANDRRFIPHGVVEALCIQVPEQTGQELVRIDPEYLDRRGIGEAFLESIVWRDPGSFSDETRLVLNELIASRKIWTQTEVIDTILTVSAIPSHPFNAEYLDRRLRQDAMPDRDMWWSTYLHDTWQSEGSVDRLIAWASSVSPSDTIDLEVLDLSDITLAWMLTTPNRFLRDRATKALVCILTDRVESLEKLLNRFADVDDPYVTERIYAVAYGVVMRSSDPAGIGRVAQSVYDSVFAHGTPQAHILLRDYARGVVERAAYLGSANRLDLDLVRPPYKSAWPDIASEDMVQDLASKMERSVEGDDEASSAWHAIEFSMSHGDFARYIIGTNSSDVSHDWLSVNLEQAVWLPAAVRRQELISKFSEPEYAAWQAYEEIRWSNTTPAISLDALFVDDSEPVDAGEFRENHSEPEDPLLPDSDGAHLIDQISRRHQRILGNGPTDSRQIDEANAHFLSVLSDANRAEWAALTEGRPGFDLSAIQRYILHRVMSLGWTADRFGSFDASVRFFRGYGREARKPERIGKKYQWIAYHEILALIADHYQFRKDWGDEREYQGPWQIGRRDIDPSAVLQSFPRDGKSRAPRQRTWWALMEYDNWQPELPMAEWTANCRDVPNLHKGLVIEQNSELGMRWINAYCFQERAEPVPPDIREYDVERKMVWVRTVAFLVPMGKADDFIDWVLTWEYWNQHWQNSINDLGGGDGAFIGEYAWGAAFLHSAEEAAANIREWCYPPGSEPNIAYTLTATHSTSGSEYDCSAHDDTSGTFYLPDHRFVLGCRLHWTGHAADYSDSCRELAAYDPSAHEDGPSALLIRADIFEKYLSENGLELCWVVTGEKQTMGTTGQPYGWLQFHGAYVYRDGQPVGKAGSNYNEPPP